MWVTEAQNESREALARRATEAARNAMPGVDVEILWDGMWVRRIGPDYFPDPDLFRPETPAPHWERWANQARKHLRDAEDYWFHVYKAAAGDIIVDIGAGRGEDVFAFSRACLGDRAASRLFPGAPEALRTEPAGECYDSKLRVHEYDCRLAH